MGQSCTLRLDVRAERCAWEGPEGTRDVGVPDAAWEVVPEGLVGRDSAGHVWEAGVAVSAAIGWLLRDGERVDGYGDGARVAEERARCQRHASAVRLAQATLVEGDAAIAELLEWAKLGRSEASVVVPSEESVAVWRAWWADRGCAAAVPREAHAAVLRSLFGLTESADGTARLALTLPATWPGWRIERWRVGRSVLDVGVARRGELVRCTILSRHGPAPVLAIAPAERRGAGWLVDGEPVTAPELRVEARSRLTLEWDAP